MTKDYYNDKYNRENKRTLEYTPDNRDNRDRPKYDPSKNPNHVQVKPGEWFHEGKVYQIDTMPIDVIVAVCKRRKGKGLFIHPKMQKRLTAEGIELN